MAFTRIGFGVACLLAAAALAAPPTEALTMRECSTAFKAAKRSGTLGGMSWRTFRKAKCGGATTPETRARNRATGGDTRGPAPRGSAYLPGGRAVFPTTIAPGYTDEVPGKARRRTCLDQYKLNRASDANGGLKWVQKGGGYYSECNKRLKSGGKG
ncbi:MAG TPA: hypothetical protein VFZ16_11395 [Hyphomicrobiaceae bacterium]|nr:hypothetical protein [Hyphomicrobiaceae bacterium]